MTGFVALVALVAIGRLVELGISRARRASLVRSGSTIVRDPGFRGMVALHVGILAAAVGEVWLAQREFVAWLGVPMLVVLAAANATRWWAIASLGRHWNVGIVDSADIGVVHHGPYRWIRHPNYVAVFVELLALPLVQGAYITSWIGAALHVPVLWRRIVREEAVLMRHDGYRAAMGAKPRFVPRRVR